MNCPVCGDALREIQKHGVEIDVCPGCKGVWLDRGELEKILELEAGGVRRPHESVKGRDHDESRHHGGHDDHGHHEGRESGQYRHGHGHRPRSLLGELFGGFGGDD